MAKYSYTFFPNISHLIITCLKSLIIKAVSISYFCLKNIGFVISSHNRYVSSSKQQSFGCNCRVKSEYPLNCKSLSPTIVCWEDVTNKSKDERKFCFLWTDLLVNRNTEIVPEISSTKSIRTAHNWKISSGSWSALISVFL